MSIMCENFISFIEGHDFFILTTHDPPDADGLGAQMIIASILRERRKQYRIINASPVPQNYRFMDPYGLIEQWNDAKHWEMPEQSAMFMIDTADLHNTGHMREIICRAREVFVIDHHDHNSGFSFPGICDATAASASEIALEIAADMGVTLDQQTAFAAYIGIAYDTGFFSYPKTGPRTFKAALSLIELGVKPNEVHRYLRENASTAALMLQKKAFAGLQLLFGGKLALQILRLEDFTETGTLPEDADGLVNVPLRARDIVVSLLVKESEDGKIRCSLRSKGDIDVSLIARNLGGGGHVNAAGLKSDLGIDRTLELVLALISRQLENQ